MDKNKEKRNMIKAMLYQNMSKSDAGETLRFVDEYAEQLNKPCVIKCDGDERKALLIDFISWYLNVFMRDKKLTKTKTPIQSIDIFLNSI